MKETSYVHFCHKDLPIPPYTQYYATWSYESARIRGILVGKDVILKRFNQSIEFPILLSWDSL